MCLLGAGLSLLKRSQFGFGDFFKKKGKSTGGQWRNLLCSQCMLITLS